MKKLIVILLLILFPLILFAQKKIIEPPIATIAIQVKMSPSIIHYYQEIVDFLQFYLKETTNLKIVKDNSKADYHFSLNVLRNSSFYQVSSGLTHQQDVIDQVTLKIQHLMPLFSGFSLIFDEMFQKAKLLKKEHQQESLNILFAFGQQKEYQKELQYLMEYSHQMFSSLMWNTQSYDTSYQMVLFNSLPRSNQTDSQNHFTFFHSFLTKNFDSLLSVLPSNTPYQLEYLLNYIIHDCYWDADHRLAVIFVSESMNILHVDQIKQKLQEAKREGIKIQFVLIDHMSPIKKNNFAQLIGVSLKDMISLQYKSIYLLSNGETASFIYDNGTLYQEHLGKDFSQFKQVSSEKHLNSFEEVPHYLLKQGYDIKKTLLSDISFSDTLGLITSSIADPVKNVSLFQSANDYFMVTNLDPKIQKILKKGKKYILQGSPFIYHSKVFLKSTSVKIVNNKPLPVFFVTVKKILSTPEIYLKNGVGKNLNWFFHAKYEGQVKLS